MGYLLLALSALALAGAGVLWRADTQEKASAKEKTSADQPSGLGNKPLASQEENSTLSSRMEEPRAEGKEVDPAETVETYDPAETSETGTPSATTESPEPAEPAEPAEPTEPVEPKDEAPEPLGKQPEAAERPEEPVQPEAKKEPKPEREKTHSRWGALSGALSGALPVAKQRGRKERREWGEAHGFEYARGDEFLQDEWGRGAASSGEAVRDVLTGTQFGHETRIADIGETTVVAMGTGMGSEVVVDMRRTGAAAGGTESPAEDLVAVAEREGFRIFASEAGPAERMMDIRVATALELLPQQVSAVWFESDWVLAQFEGTPGANEWERVFAPLALLADAARTLPPRTWPHLHVDYPTREMGEPVEAETPAKGEGNEAVRPVVVRPEEPLEMPTRTTGGVRGTMEYRTVGVDEVDAIATGKPPEQLNDGTRITRRPQPPSIFDDGEADYPG